MQRFARRSRLSRSSRSPGSAIPRRHGELHSTAPPRTQSAVSLPRCAAAERHNNDIGESPSRCQSSIPRTRAFLARRAADTPLRRGAKSSSSARPCDVRLAAAVDGGVDGTLRVLCRSSRSRRGNSHLRLRLRFVLVREVRQREKARATPLPKGRPGEATHRAGRSPKGCGPPRAGPCCGASPRSCRQVGPTPLG